MQIYSDTDKAGQRLYFLDWLRIIAFSILLFEHSAEIFVDWQFWIKNEQTSTLLSYFIAFLKPWRMPLLFIISGAAVSLAFKRKAPFEFLKERSIRLLIPLIAAMFIIIPPQIYFIKLHQGQQLNVDTFIQSLFTLKWFPKGNFHWLHLWYLCYLFEFTLIFLPVLVYFRSRKGQFYIQKLSSILSNPYVLFFTGLLLAIPYYILQNHLRIDLFAFYFPFFVFGALFCANRFILSVFSRYALLMLILATGTTLILYLLSWQSGNTLDYFLDVYNHNTLLVFSLKSFNIWFWLIAIMGYGMRFLNRPSASLTYATQAVYPFYILHQTVIVILGYYIIQLDASITIKLILIALLSFTFIYLTYELVIKRTAFTRLIFGMKLANSDSQQPSKLQQNLQDLSTKNSD